KATSAKGTFFYMCVLSHRKTRRRRRLSMSAGTAGLSCVTSRELLAPLKTARAAGGVFGLVAASPTDREQPFIVKQWVKISCCDRGAEIQKRKRRTQELARPAETSAASACRHSALLRPTRLNLPAHATLGGSQPKRSPHRLLASVRGRRPTLWSG